MIGPYADGRRKGSRGGASEISSPQGSRSSSRAVSARKVGPRAPSSRAVSGQPLVTDGGDAEKPLSSDDDEVSSNASSCLGTADVATIINEAKKLGWVDHDKPGKARAPGPASTGRVTNPTLLGEGVVDSTEMPDTDSMQQDDADVPQPEDPFDVSFVLPVLLQKQRLMEAAALLEASAETETLLLCRIKQLAVEKVISQVYPDAQWPGEVPLMMCLVSRAYARAGLEEQARWHVQAAALSLKSIGLEAAVNALGRNLRQVVPTEKANAFISSTKDDAESSASNTGRTLSAAAVAEGESSMGTARDSWRQQDNRASLSNDLLLMEFYFSLAEACFVSRGYTQAIGAFFKAIKHADRAISSLRESMGAAGQELKGDADKSALVSESTSSPRLLGLTALAVQSVPQSGLSKGAPLPSSAAPADDDQFTSGQHGSDTDVQLNDQNQEVRIAACKLELRRAELLMGVVEASLRVKEVEAIRQSEEAVEIFSRICGGPDDLRTLQARFLAAKMMHHVGQAPDAYRHLKEIIRSCACTESDVPGGMASWSAFSSPRQLAPEEESPRVHDPPLSPCTPGDERIKTEEATEKAGPAQPAFDDRTTVSARLQRRVELLMNCSLTIVELVGSLPKESQLEAVDFCGSVFGALARQSVGNLQERQRKRLLVLKLQENRRKAKHKQLVSSKKTAEKAGAAKAEAVDGGREEEEESGLVDRMEEWGGEERRRAAATSGEGFTGALLTLGRKLLGLMRSRNMRQQESEVMSLLLQFTELKFGEESVQYLSLLLDRSDQEVATGNSIEALISAQTAFNIMSQRCLFLDNSEKLLAQRAQVQIEALARAARTRESVRNSISRGSIRGRLP